MNYVNIYSDGACSGNQNEINVGGWGAILEYGAHQKEIFGGEANTTNNRMEMQALLQAFLAINKPNLVMRVFSDSSYLMNCFREKWYDKWQKNNWQTSAKKDVENRDLWEALLNYLNAHTIHFYRVKGHVNLKSKSTNVKALYDKFVEWNGASFSMEDFILITSMNNRADELANKGIEKVRNA